MGLAIFTFGILGLTLLDHPSIAYFSLALAGFSCLLFCFNEYRKAPHRWIHRASKIGLTISTIGLSLCLFLLGYPMFFMPLVSPVLLIIAIATNLLIGFIILTRNVTQGFKSLFSFHNNDTSEALEQHKSPTLSPNALLNENVMAPQIKKDTDEEILLNDVKENNNGIQISQ